MIAKPGRTPWYAAGDPWVLTQSDWGVDAGLHYESVFTQSNGRFGVRGYTEELNPGFKSRREAFLFGVIDPAGQPKPLRRRIALPGLFGCVIHLDGEPFRMSEGVITFFRRSLNLRNGLLSRHVVWASPKGRVTRLVFERALSIADPRLAMQRVTVTAQNWNGPAALQFPLDGAHEAYFRGGVWTATIPMPEGRRRVDIASESAGPGRLRVSADGLGGFSAHRLTLREGEPASVCRSVAVASPGSEVFSDAADAAAQARTAGFDVVLADSEAEWSRRWAGADIEIDGPVRDEVAVRFAAYRRLQSAPFRLEEYDRVERKRAVPVAAASVDAWYDEFTSAAGRNLERGADAGPYDAWRAVLSGLLGLRIEAGDLVLNPRLPEAWKSVTLRLSLRDNHFRVVIGHAGSRVIVEDGPVGSTTLAVIGGPSLALNGFPASP